MGEDISEAYPGLRLFFDGAANREGKGIGAVLVSESGQHYPLRLIFNLITRTTWPNTKLVFLVRKWPST